MKYIKTYENNENNLWMVIQISNTFPQAETYFFDDEKSAENYFIMLVNDNASDNDYEYDILTIEDAEKYILENECYISYQKVVSQGTYELPEEFIIARNSRKFNL